MRHHTKDKGDIGLGAVIASLMAQGIKAALPICEHLPFDLIAISGTGDLRRVSVKYRALVNGSVHVKFKSSWADRNGTHVKQHDMSTYDATAVFCPDTMECFFVRNNEISIKGLYLRVEDPKKMGRQKKIRWASEYKDAQRLFAS